MRDILSTLPLWYAKIAAMAIFLGVLLVAWLLPRSFVMADAPDTKAWRDLRIWATILTAIQLVLYCIF